MKLVRSDGRELTVRDVGPVIYRLLHAPGIPTPIVASEIMEDDAARELCHDLAALGIYQRGDVP